jgi:hypothetical protein
MPLINCRFPDLLDSLLRLPAIAGRVGHAFAGTVRARSMSGPR